MTWAEKFDELPMPAWIGLMVLGFIVAWPAGLLILGYLIWSGKMGGWKRGRMRMKEWGCRGYRHGAFRSSGNAAFDEYRDETLKRLEDEQKEFTAFLDRLKRAKDQAEFDQFMSERNGSGRPPSAPMPQQG